MDFERVKPAGEFHQNSIPLFVAATFDVALELKVLIITRGTYALHVRLFVWLTFD